MVRSGGEGNTALRYDRRLANLPGSKKFRVLFTESPSARERRGTLLSKRQACARIYFQYSSRTMKVLTVASPWMGGSGTVGFQVADYLPKLGIESYFLSYDYPFRYVEKQQERLHFSNVEPFEYPLFPFPIYELALAEKIAAQVLEHDINIIHAHYGILFGHAALLAKQAVKAQGKDVKLVLTNHGSDVLGFDLSNPGSVVPLNLNTLLVSQADAVTFVSHDLQHWSEKLYGTSEKSSIVPNGIDTEIFSPKPESTSSETINFIHISNFRPVKRPVFVVEVFVEVLKTKPNAKLTMVGDGPQMKDVVAKVQELNISDSVVFTGKMAESDLISLLQKQDVLIQPSLYESFSLVALEAHACGVSVAASKVGGLPEVVSDRESGVLIDSKASAVAFAREITAFFDTKTKLNVTKELAREQALKFSQNTVMNQYVDVYKSVLSSH